MNKGYILTLLAASPITYAALTIPSRNFIIVLLVVFLPLFILFLVLSFRLFDRLLNIQFTHAHEEWEQQGSFSGYFCTPPGSRKVSRRTLGDQWSRWFTDRPSWIDTDHSANLYAWFRFTGWLTILAGVPFFIGTVRLVAALIFGLLALVGLDLVPN